MVVVSRAELKKRVIGILKEVDLGYLADRPDVWTKETNWEEEISLGEKQRSVCTPSLRHCSFLRTSFRIKKGFENEFVEACLC